MARRIRIALLVLLLGAIVNVAAAWGFAWFVTLHWHTSGPIDDDPQIAGWLDARSWEDDLDGPWRPIWFADEHGFGRRRVHLSAMVESGTMAMPADMIVEMAGWPMAALEGHSNPEWTGSTYIWHDHGVVRVPIGKETTPLRPMWPGFVINTLFYAGLLWLLFAAPLALRRRSRIKRGLCPKCAYPVGTSPTCTECGCALK